MSRAQFFSERWNRWISRRIPRSREITLNQRNLFIFPSTAGMGFLALLLVLLLVAINYQNNLIYGLVFLLATVFVIAIHLTFANLHGISVKGGANEPVFLGERASISLEVTAKTRRRFNIEFGLQHRQISERLSHAGNDSPNITESAGTNNIAGPQSRAILDVTAVRESSHCSIVAYPVNRGSFRAGRLLIETRYPLGLVRCWSWIDVAQTTWVYPQPLKPEVSAQNDSSDFGDDTNRPSAALNHFGDDLQSFRPYQQGDTLKQIHWPSLARGDAPLVDVRAYNLSDAPDIIDFDDYPNSDTEARLSWLCYRVVEAHAANRPFLLRLPGTDIDCHSSDIKNSEALMALAQFPNHCAQPVDF